MDSWAGVGALAEGFYGCSIRALLAFSSTSFLDIYVLGDTFRCLDRPSSPTPWNAQKRRDQMSRRHFVNKRKSLSAFRRGRQRTRPENFIMRRGGYRF